MELLFSGYVKKQNKETMKMFTYELCVIEQGVALPESNPEPAKGESPLV